MYTYVEGVLITSVDNSMLCLRKRGMIDVLGI